MYSDIVSGFLYESMRVLAIGALPLMAVAIVAPLFRVLTTRFGLADSALIYAFKLILVILIISGFGMAFISELMALTQRSLK